MERSPAALGGEPTVMLDGLPGQTANRQVFVVHGDRLYAFLLMPYGDPAFDGYQAEAESVGQAVSASFSFLPTPAPALAATPTEAGNSGAATATPAVEARPTPDLGQMEIRQWSSTSPDGQWVAQVLAAFPPSQGGNYYTRFIVRKTDGTTEWRVIDNWQGLALGYTTPQPIQWSRDGRFLYFTHVPVPNGCAVFVNGSDLQRVALASGKVEQIVPPVSLWLSLSPDEKTLAYGDQQRGLVLRDLATRKERQMMLDLPTPGADMGEIAWSPDSGALVLTVAPALCGPASTTRSIMRVDLQSGSQTTLPIDEKRGFTSIAWPEPDRVEL
jgi:hypothetical protein